MLRSKDPEGVMQEMWALFAVYQAICRIVGIAVNAAGIPPARISFPHALAAATIPSRLFPPDQADHAFATSLLKILMPGFFVRGRPAGPARGKPRRPATSPPGSPASPASPTSCGESSSTCSTHGRSSKSKAIGPRPDYYIRPWP